MQKTRITPRESNNKLLNEIGPFSKLFRLSGEYIIMFVAFTTFPVQDPNVLVMILLAVPVLVIMWQIIASGFASRADKAIIKE